MAESILLSRIGTNGLTQDSYTASTTYSADHPSSAFDGCYPDDNTGDGSTNNTKVLRGGWYSTTRLNQWLQIDFGGNNFIVNKLRYHHRYNTLQIPKDCVLQCSNDNINFENIESFQMQAITGWQEFNVTINKKYRYYRLFIYSNWGTSNNLIEVGELEYWGYTRIGNFFIQNKTNNNIYTLDTSGNIILSPSQIVDESNYITNGFNDLLNSSQVSQLKTIDSISNFKLLMYTDNTTATSATLNYNCESYRPVDKANPQFDIVMYKE